MNDVSLIEKALGWFKRHPHLAFLLRAPVRLLRYSRVWGQQCATCLSFVWYWVWLRFIAGRRIPSHAPGQPMNGTRQIVMVIWGHLPTDPRVEREARALAGSGFHVTILCPSWSPPSPAPDWGHGVEIKLLDHNVVTPMKTFPWLLAPGLVQATMAENPWAYHAHDLNAVLPVLLAAATKRVPCVCDFHEWYSENVTYDAKTESYRPHSWIKRLVFRSIEKLALRCASRIVTVCDSIASALTTMHDSGALVAVVRNIPPIEPVQSATKPTIDLRKVLNIPADKAVLLYQGGVGPSRGLEPLIEAMGMVRHAVLVIRGPGIETSQSRYLDLAAQAGAGNRVFCLPPVSSQTCVSEARAADLGFWTLLPICKNFTYALPNKVFEYMAAGLPLVCAHHPEVAQIVNRFDVGRCFDPVDPASIAAAVDELARDVILRKRCQANITQALSALRADAEWAKLVELYREIDHCNQDADQRHVIAISSASGAKTARQKAG